jgi:hypothetical protein
MECVFRYRVIGRLVGESRLTAGRDDLGLTGTLLTTGGRVLLRQRREIAWRDVTGAGVSAKRSVDMRAIVRPGVEGAVNRLDDLLPGVESLNGRAEGLAHDTELLLIAHRPMSRLRLVTCTILSSGEDRAALVDEPRRRSGDRWISELLSLPDLRRRLGISNAWVAPRRSRHAHGGVAASSCLSDVSVAA